LLGGGGGVGGSIGSGLHVINTKRLITNPTVTKYIFFIFVRFSLIKDESMFIKRGTVSILSLLN